MLVDKIILATRDDELDYLLSGGATVDVTRAYDGDMPFGFFPQKGIDKLTFKDITIICGSSTSGKYLLLRIIAAKLGIKEAFINMRCFEDYLWLCSIKYTVHGNRDFPCRMITRAQCEKYVNDIYSKLDKYDGCGILSLYESIINEKGIYILEDPEIGLSTSEQIMLCDLIKDSVEYYGAQFIILTTSPIFMSLNKLAIYDMDERPFISRPRSELECFCLYSKHLETWKRKKEKCEI